MCWLPGPNITTAMPTPLNGLGPIKRCANGSQNMPLEFSAGFRARNTRCRQPLVALFLSCLPVQAHQLLPAPTRRTCRSLRPTSRRCWPARSGACRRSAQPPSSRRAGSPPPWAPGTPADTGRGSNAAPPPVCPPAGPLQAVRGGIDGRVGEHGGCSRTAQDGAGGRREEDGSADFVVGQRISE
jgi:hypothetical protein